MVRKHPKDVMVEVNVNEEEEEWVVLSIVRL
jgi:hypothetical protein